MSPKHFFGKRTKDLALQTKDALDLYLIKRQRSGEVRQWDLVQTSLRLIIPERQKSEAEHLPRYSPGGRWPRPAASLMFRFFPAHVVSDPNPAMRRRAAGLINENIDALEPIDGRWPRLPDLQPHLHHRSWGGQGWG